MSDSAEQIAGSMGDCGRCRIGFIRASEKPLA